MARIGPHTGLSAAPAPRPAERTSSGVVLSVVIPTHNRARDVLENLSALLPQCEGKPVEVIVVDSASAPVEAAVLAGLRERPGVALVRLDEPGVSIARNAGIARARGTWAAFLDDDAVPRLDWAEAALRRVGACGPEIGFVAGRVLPRWPEAPPGRGVEPARLGPRWRMLLSIVDDPRSYRGAGASFGVSANLLIRRSALDAIGGFPAGMGRVGTSLASGEDPYVMDRIIAEGLQGWYDGGLVVEHKIHAGRLTPEWVEERARHEGAVSLAKVGRWSVRLLVAAKAAASLPVLAALKRFDSPEAEYFIRFQHNVGFVASYLRRVSRLADPDVGWPMRPR